MTKLTAATVGLICLGIGMGFGIGIGTMRSESLAEAIQTRERLAQELEESQAKVRAAEAELERLTAEAGRQRERSARSKEDAAQATEVARKPETDLAPELLAAAMDVPAATWSSKAKGRSDQVDAFTDWFLADHGEAQPMVPEILPTVTKWLESDAQSLNTTVVNKPTGARFGVTGAREGDRVWCVIKFIGRS